MSGKELLKSCYRDTKPKETLPCPDQLVSCHTFRHSLHTWPRRRLSSGAQEQLIDLIDELLRTFIGVVLDAIGSYAQYCYLHGLSSFVHVLALVLRHDLDKVPSLFLLCAHSASIKQTHVWALVVVYFHSARQQGSEDLNISLGAADNVVHCQGNQRWASSAIHISLHEDDWRDWCDSGCVTCCQRMGLLHSQPCRQLCLFLAGVPHNPAVWSGWGFCLFVVFNTNTFTIFPWHWAEALQSLGCAGHSHIFISPVWHLHVDNKLCYLHCFCRAGTEMVVSLDRLYYFKSVVYICQFKRTPDISETAYCTSWSLYYVFVDTQVLSSRAIIPFPLYCWLLPFLCSSGLHGCIVVT